MRPRKLATVVTILLALWSAAVFGQTVSVGNRAGTATTLATISSGSGSPEGAVIGKPGDVYICLASCSGNGLWTKSTGSLTNTGWTALSTGAGFLVASGTPTAGRFAVWDSTTALEDITNTAATALLDGCVGDSGSGGTKGLVPAPGSGDTAAGKFLKADCSWAVPAGGGGGGDDHTIGITIDGGGSAISTGVKGFVVVPFTGTITAATLLSTDASATTGDIVIDVWVDTYANYPPTNADSITSSTPPTLSSANKSQDTTLTSWTTSITAGDVVGFNVDSASTVTRVTLLLTVTP